VLLGLLTKNILFTAIVAAVVNGTIGLLYLINSSLYEGLFYEIISGMSLFGRFTAFSYGIFDVGTVVYDLSFIAFFLYLTYQVMEKKRWS
jgi:ABC-2 type transport system permease protein